MNAPVSDPGEIIRVAGTVATEVLLLESATTAPDGGAVLRVTVPVDVLPLPTLVGFNTREDTEIPVDPEGFTVTNSLLWMLPP